MNEGKATRYHRQRRRARSGAVLGGLTLLVGFLVGGGAASLRGTLTLWPDGPGGASPWYGPTCYGGLVWLALEAWLFPFRFYQSVILERRYRLSEPRAFSWLSTTLTTSVLNVALVAFAATVVFTARFWWPQVWWIVCGMLFSLTTLAITTLAPGWILPWVSTTRPLERPALQRRLAALAARVGVPPIPVAELLVGRPGRRAYALLVGLGAGRQILLSETFLSDYSDAEIEAVTAHELGHHVHLDLWQTAIYELGVALAALWTADRVVTMAGPLVGVTGATDLASLPLLGLAAGGIVVVAAPLGHALSRRHERRADRFALRYCSEPAALASSLRRLGEQHLAEPSPSRMVELFWHSHPPLDRRLSQLANPSGAG